MQTHITAHIHTRTTKSHTPTFVAAVMSHRHTVWKKNNKIASLMATLIIHVIIGCTQQVTLERGAPRQPIAVQKTSSETGFDRFFPQLTLPSCVPSASVQASPHPHYLRRKKTTHNTHKYAHNCIVYTRHMLTRSRRVFGIVKNEDVSRRCLCPDDELILWHVAGTIDLAVVIDLYVNLYLATHRPKPSVLWVCVCVCVCVMSVVCDECSV